MQVQTKSFYSARYLIFLMALALLGMILSGWLTYYIVTAQYGAGAPLDLMQLAKKYDNAWDVIRIAQLLYSGMTFLAPALIILWMYKRSGIESTPKNTSSKWVYLLMPFLLLTFLPFVEVVYNLNQGIQFAEPLQSILLEMEKQNNELIDAMLKSHSIRDISFNFFIIAVGAAVTEELFFRGAMQRILSNIVHPHFAILISAVLFSAIHFQFFGFLPRMALGILFGYLYWRSGRMMLAISAHILFNGSQLLAYYLFRLDSGEGFSESEPTYNFIMTLSSTLLFFILYYIFHTILTKNLTQQHVIK